MPARPSIDRRTRPLSEAVPLTVADVLGDAGGAAVATNRRLAADAQQTLGLPPLTVDVAGELVTFTDGLIVKGTVRGAITAELEPERFGTLVAGLSGFSSYVVHDLAIGVAEPRLYVLWDYVIRSLFEGRALHDPAVDTVPDGAGLGLSHAFTPEDDDDEIAAFLADAGFVHLRGWITPDVLPHIDREVAAAADAASKRDPHHLWTRLENGTERCVRIRYLLRHSPSMAALVEGDVFMRLGDLFADGHVRTPDVPFSSEALIKPLGHVAKVTDLPWHRDCGGRCAWSCSAYTVGLPLSATNAEVGMLQVVAGSHRANVPPPGFVADVDWGLPTISLPTEPGDLTIHLGCALHSTTTSLDVERTVAYTTFPLTPLGTKS